MQAPKLIPPEGWIEYIELKTGERAYQHADGMRLRWRQHGPLRAYGWSWRAPSGHVGLIVTEYPFKEALMHCQKGGVL